MFAVPYAVSSFDSPNQGALHADPLLELAAATRVPSASTEEVYDESPGIDGALAQDQAVSVRRGLTPNVLTFDYPGADDIDRWLSPTLIVIGLLILLSTSSSPDTRGYGWIAVTRFLTHAVLYCALVFPVTLGMLRKAGRELRYAMPPKFRTRCFACYLPAFVLVVLSGNDGFTLSQFFGGLVGLVISSSLVWLLFRLREEQVGTTVIYGAGGFAAGTLITIILILALNSICKVVVMNQQCQASVPVSPFGEGLSWFGTSTALSSVPIAAVPTTATVDAAAVSGPTPVSGIAGSFDTGQIPGVIDDILNPLNESPNIGVIRRKGTAVSVECWSTLTWKPRNGTLQLPAMPANGIVISPDGERAAWIADFPHRSIQVWSFDSASVIYSVDLDRSQGHTELIGFTAPDLLLVDRIEKKSAFPATAPVGLEKTTLAPPESTHRLKTPAFFGLSGDPQPVPPVAAPTPVPAVPAQPDDKPQIAHVEMVHLLSSVQITTGKNVRTILLPELAQSLETAANKTLSTPVQIGRNFAVSLVSNRLAAAIQTSDSPSLIQFDLSTGQRLTTINVPEVDPGMSGSLTGLVYSNDGQRLAAMFEKGGSALLMAYDAGTASPISNFVFPAGPLENPTHGPFDGSAICWLDPQPFWLVFGKGFLSTKSGSHLKQADLPLSDSTSQRFCDGNRIQILSGANGAKQLHLLKLDIAKMSQYSGE